MRIGVAYPAGRDSDQDFGRGDLWECNLGIFQWSAELHQSHGPHKRLTRESQRCIYQRMQM